MGADLIVQVFEIGKEEEPDWKRAELKLDTLSDDALIAGLERWLQDDSTTLFETREAAVKEARARGAKGLAAIRGMWEQGWRVSACAELRRSQVLIAGALSWGDVPYDEYDDVEIARALGLPATAGFWEDVGNGVSLRVG